jgi:lipopolysaccharide export system permease protein
MLHMARYVVGTMIGSIAMVMVVLTVLGGLFTFIGEQDSIGVGHYDVLQALLYTAMNLPRFALESLPAGVLVGAMLGIGALARSNEITAMRAAGMSKPRLLGAALGGGVLVMAAALLVNEYVAPQLEQLGDQRKAFAKYQDISFAGQGGAWMRDGDSIINVASQTSAAQFGGLLAFHFRADGRIDAIGRAARASNAQSGRWQLSDYRETRFSGDNTPATQESARELLSPNSAGFLQLAVAGPSQMALQTLRAAIDYRRQNSLDISAYEFAFWSRVARTVALLVAMLFAIPFGYGLLRSSGSGARAALGLGIGLIYFFLQRIVESGTLVFGLDPLLLAWLPTLLLALAAGVLLWRAR